MARRGRGADPADQRPPVPAHGPVEPVGARDRGRGPRADDDERLDLVTVTAVEVGSTCAMPSSTTTPSRGRRGCRGARERRATTGRGCRPPSAPGPDQAHTGADFAPDLAVRPGRPGRSDPGRGGARPGRGAGTRTRGPSWSGRGSGPVDGRAERVDPPSGSHGPTSASTAGGDGQGGRVDLHDVVVKARGILHNREGGPFGDPRSRGHRRAPARRRPGHPPAPVPRRAPQVLRGRHRARRRDDHPRRRGEVVAPTTCHRSRSSRPGAAAPGADRSDPAGPAHGVGGEGRWPAAARVARQGTEVERTARPVTVHQFEVAPVTERTGVDSGRR